MGKLRLTDFSIEYFEIVQIPDFDLPCGSRIGYMK